MTISWWRSWHGAPTDHKWAVIANRAGVKVGIVSAVAWALLDYASQHESRGMVAGFDTETYAVYSGFDEREIIAVIQAMTDKGIITDGRLTNWEKRQTKREDETSSARVRKWREMKHNVTQGNAEQQQDKDKEEDTYTDNYDDGDGWQPEIQPEIFGLYLQNIGQITPIIAEDLKDLEKEFTAGWVADAITEASRHNAKSVKYISAILKNRRDGKQKPTGKPGGSGNGNGKGETAAQKKYREDMDYLNKVISGEIQA